MVSNADDRVLNAIFQPHLPIVTDLVQDAIEPTDESLDAGALDDCTKKAKELEISAVKEAEASDLEKSLHLFNEAIDICPSLASLYNNRAQLYRILGDIESAKVDLDRAIELSAGHGKTAAQAYTQRALLLKREGQEDLAMEDFKKASKLGSGFAKIHMIESNPYAAMCNQMLNEVMGKIRRGEQDGSI